ncbi:hypothetical protein LWI28_019253 [Acer negundo]|uniref:RBR-type E3 ubiquitin transferase n=1 Tax=Acer negundo TaxID=4023 RepID=A0AAD5JB94_ACENE|nr:hypothetical protein LWI28_019253 [Acer negundo]
MGNKFGSCSRLSRCNEEEDKTTSSEIKQEDLEENGEVYKTPRSHMSDEEQDITDQFSKFEDNVTSIPFPESTCDSGMIEPDHCRLILPHLDDEEYFYFTPNIPHKGITKETAISVEQYNEDRDLQIAITASLLYNDGDDDDLRILTVKPENTPFGRKTKPFSSPSITETGQSSNSKSNNNDDPPFVCEICFEPKNSNESFKIKGCSHAYCVDCMSNCPESDCRGLLETEYCRNLLPQEVFDRWGNALCEAVILGAQKFYCPFKDCSALLIDGGEAISQSECPNCNRLFCAQCKVAWHFGIVCTEFQKLKNGEREREDIMLMNLAQKQKWKRCPNCGFYVEKKDGCMYMKCRCRTAFCYNCGSVADAMNRTFHYCSKCKR